MDHARRSESGNVGIATTAATLAAGVSDAFGGVAAAGDGDWGWGDSGGWGGWVACATTRSTSLAAAEARKASGVAVLLPRGFLRPAGTSTRRCAA